MNSRLATIALLFSTVFISGCASVPPRNQDDICTIFRERPSWRKPALQASKQWGISVPVLMAIIHQESSFRANKRPDRVWHLGFIPGRRPSSAYGYAQALNETWRHYRQETGKKWASRRSFSDAIDFVGWYCDRSHQLCRIGQEDTFNLYLAYHEGPGGYNRGTHLQQPWLIKVAERVKRQADLYHRQWRNCPPN